MDVWGYEDEKEGWSWRTEGEEDESREGERRLVSRGVKLRLDQSSCHQQDCLRSVRRRKQTWQSQTRQNKRRKGPTFRAETPEATFVKQSITRHPYIGHDRLPASGLQVAALWPCGLLLIHDTVTMFGIQARFYLGGRVPRSKLDVKELTWELGADEEYVPARAAGSLWERKVLISRNFDSTMAHRDQ